MKKKSTKCLNEFTFVMLAAKKEKKRKGWKGKE